MRLKANLIQGFIFLFFCQYVISQNLVVNGSFEDYTICPVKTGVLGYSCEGITAPTTGSTDYFHTCGKTQVQVPNNFNGAQEAYHGDAYAGLYLYSPNDYREYIQFNLKEPLEKGKLYKVSIRLSLAENSVLAVQNASVLFTQDRLALNTNKNLSKMRLENFNIKNYTYQDLGVKKSIFNKEEWGLLETEYIAKGNERYIMFGNFKNNKKTNHVRLDFKTKTISLKSYYYIDDVSLELKKEKKYALNKPFVLNKLQFKHDSYELSESAKRDIKKVFVYLKRNPKVDLEIFGHTDNSGTPAYNKYLSSRRARSVALYIESLGIPENRIKWVGKGDKAPLFESDSDKARNANRRVEFVITEFEDDDQ